MIDIQQLRHETPGVDAVIHFNNAGSSLMSKPVFDAIANYQHEELVYGGYEAAEKYHHQLEEFYPVTAELINASTFEIAFAFSATEAWNSIFYALNWQPGDEVITNVAEYASNYISYLQLKKRKGISIRVIPNNHFGETDPDAVQPFLNGKTRLIAMTHMPTNGGLVNPAERIGEIARKNNIPYLLDACQSVGQYPIDVNKLQCDFLAATGRKYLRGPRGSGFLYVRSKWLKDLEPPTLDLYAATWTAQDQYNLREGARRFESWEFNPALKLGLKLAISQLHQLGQESVWERVVFLGKHLRSGLGNINGVQLADLGRVKSGIVTFSVTGIPAEEVKNQLRKRKINVSVAEASGTLLDMEERGIEKLIRASVHYYNSEEEIDIFCHAIKELTIRKMPAPTKTN